MAGTTWHARTVQFQRLTPDPGPVEIDELLSGLRLAELASAQRPHAAANFVASADGRAALHGRSGALGDNGDHAIFQGLREQADAVLAGTGTLRSERYGRIIRDPRRRARRAERGARPEPLASTVTRSGDLPTDIPIFAEPEARIVVFTAAEIDLRDCVAQIDLVRLDPGELTLTTVLRRLRHDYDVRFLLCEGGPTLFGSLLREGVVDELFLTIAPRLAGGGTGPTIAGGPELDPARRLGLKWVLGRAGSLYVRYWLD